jgi:hypothetical protein
MVSLFFASDPKDNAPNVYLDLVLDGNVVSI